MPKRPGDWHLLNHAEDPLIADIPQSTTEWRTLPRYCRHNGNRSADLAKIANRESSRGKYADKLRQSASEVAASLQKTVGRYYAVVDAMTGYAPELDTALKDSAAALDDAMDADRMRGAANAPPTATPAEGKELTPEQRSANEDKDEAKHAAVDHLATA